MLIHERVVGVGVCDQEPSDMMFSFGNPTLWGFVLVETESDSSPSFFMMETGSVGSPLVEEAELLEEA